MLRKNLDLKKIFLPVCLLSITNILFSQLKWHNVDSLFQPLPSSVHIYFTNDKIDTGAFRAFYLIADIKDKHLHFTTDTTYQRRLTPAQFYKKNGNPLVVVNCTFFEFTNNSNLNLVMRNGKMLARNQQTIPLKGKDTLKYAHVFPSAIGITKKRTADVAWTYTADKSKPRAMQWSHNSFVDSNKLLSLDTAMYHTSIVTRRPHEGKSTTSLKKWKMRTAVGGGPVILQDGKIKITNNEERKFGGKAINDKHPRTAMGYTKDNKLIILVIEGRNPNASGATLTQEAQILKDLGCIEALNLDGGGSSCMLVNGKETIRISDKSQRPVPAVFLIKEK